LDFQWPWSIDSSQIGKFILNWRQMWHDVSAGDRYILPSMNTHLHMITFTQEGKSSF
jgi:hypothetical protein